MIEFRNGKNEEVLATYSNDVAASAAFAASHLLSDMLNKALNAGKEFRIDVTETELRVRIADKKTYPPKGVA